MKKFTVGLGPFGSETIEADEYQIDSGSLTFWMDEKIGIMAHVVTYAAGSWFSFRAAADDPCTEATKAVS